MYKMTIDVAGEGRIFLFRGPGCRKTCSSGGVTISTAPKAGGDPQHSRLGNRRQQNRPRPPMGPRSGAVNYPASLVAAA